MRLALVEASKHNLANEDTKEVERLLALKDNGNAGGAGEIQFLEKQLETATAKGDEKWKVELKGSLRGLLIKNFPRRYDLRCVVRPADEWANLTWWTWSRLRLAQSMLVYSDGALHAPLTRLPDSRSETDALAHFTHLLELGTALTMDAAKQKSAHLIAMASAAPGGLRGEIWCQIIKQLTNNPGGLCREYLWRLLGSLVRFCRPDGEDMCCVVEAFIRRFEGPTALNRLQAFHALVFGSTPRLIATDDDVREFAADTNAPPQESEWEKAVRRTHQMENLRACF